MQDSSVNILVSGLMQSKDILKEHEQLDRLLLALKGSHLLQSNFRHRIDSDDLESDFLANATLDDVETHIIPKDLLANQSNLRSLVSYAFERRFGWSEQESSQENERKSKQSELNNPGSGGSPYHRLRTGSLPYAEETRTKAMLNCKLDELINLLAIEEKLNNQLLDAYVFAIAQASSLPVVRSQLLCHIFRWLSFVMSDEIVIKTAVFHLIKLIIIAGVTDVWSAIRNTTVSRIISFVEYFSLAQIEDVFVTFAKICNDNSSTWQAKEGAIMAIAGILQCFKLAIVQKSVLDRDASGCSGTVVCRKLGKHHFMSLPPFIIEPLQTTVYELLSNPQLSIKEHANRAFCSFLLRSEFSQVLNVFKEVLLYLANKSFSWKQKCSSNWKFAEASTVDGYIKAAEFLVKHVPVGYILHNWNVCFATLSHYLMHPASTVRQAASSVLKYLAAKQTQTLMLPQLVTHSLSYSWKTNINLLKEPLSTLSCGKQRSSVKRFEKNCDFDVTESWEWREGRLLAYELILKFLITNHIHYTFPAYTLTRTMQSKTSTEDHRKTSEVHSKFSVSHNFGSDQSKGFTRHEPLSRSLTMESDPITQKFVSSLIEKEKAKNQTFSLLELMRKSDNEVPSHNFNENLQASFYKDAEMENYITEESLKLLRDFSEDQLSKNGLPMKISDNMSFGKVLIQIFLQTLECLADTRWELRRMAYQVLPLVSEAIRFYDPKILENLWESQLSCDTNLLGFGACVSLRDSLAHVTKLVKYFENPPGFWKDIDRCRLAAKRIVDSINEKLPGLLMKAVDIVNRSSFDRLTIISVEVLMLSIVHFPQENMKQHMVSVITKKIERLFTFAYPENLFAIFLLEINPITEFESATTGVLSCAPKNMNAVSRACKSSTFIAEQINSLIFKIWKELLKAFVMHCKFPSERIRDPHSPSFQLCNMLGKIVVALDLRCSRDALQLLQIETLVQDTLFVEVQRLLPAFLRSSVFECVVSFLPIMLHEISSLIDAATDVQPLFQACHGLLKDKITQDTELSRSTRKVLSFAVDEICGIIKSKNLETHFLRQYLDILIIILRISDNSASLQPVFIAIATKMRSEGFQSTVMGKEESQDEETVQGNSEDEFLRIRLLSNDIRQSPIEDVHILIEDDHEDSPRNLPESQALGSAMFKQNSNIDNCTDEQRNQSPIEREASPFEEDFDSDWDSWEEDDEESMSQIRGAFSTFLLNLKLTSHSAEASFGQALKACECKDRKIIESLMSCDGQTRG